MPDNVRRGRPQGKCHRKQAAPAAAGVRVKGWGKGPPRRRQRRRHGKPHREQYRIGAARNLGSGASPDQPPGLVARGAQQCASQMNGRHAGPARHTEPGLQAGWQFSPFGCVCDQPFNVIPLPTDRVPYGDLCQFPPCSAFRRLQEIRAVRGFGNLLLNLPKV